MLGKSSLSVLIQCVQDGEVQSYEAGELFSNQEEADTKGFLCCKHAEVMGHQHACIVTVDSDIVIYAIYFARLLEINMYVRIGAKSSRQMLDTKAIHNNIGESIADAVPRLHAFTGNDYTSAFNSKGKVKAMKAVKTDKRFQHAFSHIGDQIEFDVDLIEIMEEFVCILYGIN